MLTAPADPGRLTALLRVLGEPTRRRILALLEEEELAVGELARSLGMAQSRVSNHLRVLREHGLLRERRAGSSTFLRLAPGEEDGDLPARLWRALGPEVRASDAHALDRERLRAVLAERRERSRDFFDRVAGEWDAIGVEFTTGAGRLLCATQLLPATAVIGDLGCGTGYMGRALIGICAKLVCVDRSEGMLAEARRRIGPVPDGTEIEFRLGELDDLPVADEELDGALVGMVLHHLSDPLPFLREVLRVLKPGAALAALDLFPHDEAWMHEALGDHHLGLEPDRVVAALRSAGFVALSSEPAPDRYRPRTRAGEQGPALPLFVVRGRKPPQPSPSEPHPSNTP